MLILRPGRFSVAPSGERHGRAEQRAQQRRESLAHRHSRLLHRRHSSRVVARFANFGPLARLYGVCYCQ